MIRKIFLAALVGAIGLGAATTAMAQLGELRGHIYMKKPDGTKVPVEGALVEFYRTDIAGKAQVKTKKDGGYVHAGLQFVGTYTIAVSAPGATPKTRSELRPGRGQDIDIELDPGDGRVPTEAEVKASVAAGPATADRKESAEEKAKREADLAKLAAATAERDKTINANAVVTASFKEGRELYTAGVAAAGSKQYATAVTKYGEAIAKFDEGINVDPDHPGASSLLTEKARSLMERGKNEFNLSVTSTSPDEQKSNREAAKRDLAAAVEASSKAVTLVLAAPDDIKTGPNYAGNKLASLYYRAQAYRYLTSLADQSKVNEGEIAYNEYIGAQTKPEAKDEAQMELAKLLFDGGEYAKSIAKYQEILAAKADNLEANYGMGLAMVSAGAIVSEAGDKAKIEEGLGYLQAFADKAPAEDPRKKEVLDMITEYKNSKNFKPAKPPASGRRRGN